MKKKNIFDMFENAEDELMDDFTDMSPEISDERLDKLLAVSERNYKMEKERIERAKKDNNINYDADSVSGVDRVKRPVWLTPLITAASLVLVTGAVIGSVLLLNRNGGLSDRGGVTPAVTAVTTDEKNTETTLNGSGTTSVKTTSTQTVTTVSTSAKENIAETNVQVIETQKADATTTSKTGSQDEAFAGRLNQGYQENYRNVITNYLDEAALSDEDFCLEYVLKDVTGDGTPELIIKHGHCEADSFVTVYNSDLKVIGDRFRGSYTGFYENSSGAFAFATAHMGYFYVSYPVYDTASDYLTIENSDEKSYETADEIDVLLQEEGLTALNVASISVRGGSVKSYYNGQSFDYPYFGIIV